MIYISKHAILTEFLLSLESSEPSIDMPFSDGIPCPLKGVRVLDLSCLSLDPGRVKV